MPVLISLRSFAAVEKKEARSRALKQAITIFFIFYYLFVEKKEARSRALKHYDN